MGVCGCEYFVGERDDIAVDAFGCFQPVKRA